MNKIGLRITLILFFLILFGGSFFAVLASEENKRLTKSKVDQEQFLSDVREIERARQTYLENVLQARTASKEGMATAKKQYEKLLSDQPALIQQNRKQTTTTVKQLVPVATSSNVSSTQASKPKSTTKTKTS